MRGDASGRSGYGANAGAALGVRGEFAVAGLISHGEPAAAGFTANRSPLSSCAARGFLCLKNPP